MNLLKPRSLATRAVARWWLLLLAGLFALQLVSLYVYVLDQRYLSALMDRIASPSLPPSEQVKLIIAYLRDHPSNTNDSYLFLPLFGPLRATPRQVAVHGGDCADRSRLLVVLLGLRGIRGSKWALYSPDDIPDHAVVELDAEQGKMVVDGLFGLWFPRPGGGYYGIQDLRQNPRILSERVLELRAKKQRPGTDKLEQYPLMRYVYNAPHSINWEKSALTRLVYRILHKVLGARVDDMPRPAISEQPALMLIVLLAGGEITIVLIRFLVVWHRKRSGIVVAPIRGTDCAMNPASRGS
jgi:hypothetical protein